MGLYCLPEENGPEQRAGRALPAKFQMKSWRGYGEKSAKAVSGGRCFLGHKRPYPVVCSSEQHSCGDLLIQEIFGGGMVGDAGRN